MRRLTELEVIDRLRAAFPASGIGDDTAVLPAPQGDLLFAADACVEGVHFDLAFSSLSQAVQKLVTSNVSDIFAMGGSPGSIVFTAGLREGCTPADVDGIIDGLRRACAQYGVTLAGGDTVLSPGRFVFNVAIAGEVRPGRAIRRAGAREGDAIVLFGPIGGSRAGLGILADLFGARGEGRTPVPAVPSLGRRTAAMKRAVAGLSLATSDEELERTALSLSKTPRGADVLRCVRRHLVPLARPLDPAVATCEAPCVTSMIDVSDGVAKDLRTLCAESGVGALVREDALPLSSGVGEILGLEGSALAEFAVASGEEYVLLATVDPEGLGLLGGGAHGRAGRACRGRLGFGATVIGSIVPAADGVMLADESGRRRPMPAVGYEHAF